MLAILAGAFPVFGAMLGRNRPSIKLAMIAYGLGCGTVVGAMLVDGFVVPQVAAQFVAAPAADVEVVTIILRVCGSLSSVDQVRPAVHARCVTWVVLRTGHWRELAALLRGA